MKHWKSGIMQLFVMIACIYAIFRMAFGMQSQPELACAALLAGVVLGIIGFVLVTKVTNGE